MAKCSYPKCGAHAMKASIDGRCFWHTEDAEVVVKRELAQSKGGRSGIPNVPFINTTTQEGLVELLCHTISGVRRSSSGTIIERSRTVGYLAGILSDIIEK